MKEILLIIGCASVVGVILGCLKLYIGFGLAAAGSASYLGFYYTTEKFIEALKKDAPAAFEAYDFSGQYASVTFIAWIVLGMSLLTLLFHGSSKSD